MMKHLKYFFTGLLILTIITGVCASMVGLTMLLFTNPQYLDIAIVIGAMMAYIAIAYNVGKGFYESACR